MVYDVYNLSHDLIYLLEAYAHLNKSLITIRSFCFIVYEIDYTNTQENRTKTTQHSQITYDVSDTNKYHVF